MQVEYVPERPERSNARGTLSCQTESTLPRCLLSSRTPRRHLEAQQLSQHTHWATLEKPPTLGGIEGRGERGRQRVRWLEGITNSMEMSLSKLREMVKDREVCHAAVHEVAKSRTQLSD